MDTIDQSLNGFLGIKDVQTFTNHSLKLRKERDEKEQIENYEKNIRLYSRLNTENMETTEYNEELYLDFKNSFKTLIVGRKNREAYNILLNGFEESKNKHAMELVKFSILNDLRDYKQLIIKRLKTLSIRYRNCKTCPATYPTFLKSSRHCLNCKALTSIKNEYDSELRKELDRLYGNINQRNLYLLKIKQLDKLFL